jgi:hypothetical protein
MDRSTSGSRDSAHSVDTTTVLYRGESAERQIRAVIENHDIYAYPIEKYPIEEADSFAENDP